MRSSIKFKIAAFLFCLTLLGSARTTLALEDAIVAIVNKEVITLSDLKTYIHNTYVSLVTQGLSPEDLNQVMQDLEVNGVDKLIEDKLMLSEANKIGILVRDKLIDDRILEIKTKYANDQVFTDALIKNGATLTDLKNKILDDFKIKYLIETQVHNKIYVNPQEVTDFYEKNKDLFSRKERVKLNAIYVPFTDIKETSGQKAREALEAIENGQDFQAVAQTYSAPTSFDVVERGQLKSSIEDQLFKLEVGQHSGIIEVDDGYYIFLVTAKTPPKQAPMEEVKDTVENLVFKAKFRKRIEEYLEKLKKNAYIEIRK